MSLSHCELNIEYRTVNFELRSFKTVLVFFDIHHSLFDILRFKTRQKQSSTSAQPVKKLPSMTPSHA